MSGLIADSRTMVDKARVEAQVGVCVCVCFTVGCLFEGCKFLRIS